MEADEPKPPSPRQLSKIPSWISLGFVLGALFVWSLPPPATDPAAPAVVRSPTPTAPAGSQVPPTLSDIEAVFAVWGHHAVWAHDLTEVALWDSQSLAFSRYYEVLRSGENYYFRSLDRLTRPILTHGVREDSPLQYTETEEMRQQWLREKRSEDWKAISNAIPKAFVPPVPSATNQGP